MKILNKSIPNKGKLQNGDSYQVYEDDTILIACVADGVGGCPCDWKASEQLCQDIIFYYTHEFKNLGVLDGMAFSLRKTFARLYWTKGECDGMLSTLVALIIDKKEQKYYTISIGDSKIFKWEDKQLTELSTETECRIQPDALLSYVRFVGVLTPNIGFALMSDGFWANRKNYINEIEYLFGKDELENDFHSLFLLNELTQSDDMTLMIIK